MVNFLLGLIVVLGTVGLALTLGLDLIPAFNRGCFIGAYAVLLALFLARGLPDNVRAVGLLLVLYAFGALALRTGWLAAGASS